MVAGPARPTDTTIAQLKGLLQPGDVVADGGNSHWKDSVRHYEELKASRISFLDVGISGGEGARSGACFMAGGDADAFVTIEPLPRHGFGGHPLHKKSEHR